jgi:predicted HTH domain antitoxin
MTLHIAIPSGIEHQLKVEWGVDFERRALEALAIEGYRTGALSSGQVAEMLRVSRYEADGFLKERGVEPPFSLDEFRQSNIALEALLAR